MLQIDGYCGLRCFKAIKNRGFKNGLMITGRYITKGEEDGITRVVVTGIKIPKLLVAEIGNVCRVATTVVMLGVSRKEFEAEPVP